MNSQIDRPVDSNRARRQGAKEVGVACRLGAQLFFVVAKFYAAA
jgi:hypothetical protein